MWPKGRNSYLYLKKVFKSCYWPKFRRGSSKLARHFLVGPIRRLGRSSCLAAFRGGKDATGRNSLAQGAKGGNGVWLVSRKKLKAGNAASLEGPG